MHTVLILVFCQRRRIVSFLRPSNAEVSLAIATNVRTLKKGEHVYVSGELRYREYDKEVGKAKDTVKMPVAEIHAGEIRRLDPKATQNIGAPAD